MYIYVYIATFYDVLQSEKFQWASKVTMKLVSLASEAKKCNFARRYKLLGQLADAWERDKKVWLLKVTRCLHTDNETDEKLEVEEIKALEGEEICEF